EVVAMCFDPIRPQGIAHLSVVQALLDAIRESAEVCPNRGRRAVLGNHARLIHAEFLRERPTDREIAIVEAALERTTATVERE
ncbi:MAG: hypothetical protein WBG86_02080, partial [Polyangiales bacterium]